MPSSICLLQKQTAFEFPTKTTRYQWILPQGNQLGLKLLKGTSLPSFKSNLFTGGRTISCTWDSAPSFIAQAFMMTVCEDQHKDWLKNWQLCIGRKLTLCDHRVIKLMQNCIHALPICELILLFCLLSLINTTLRYMNFSTWCSALLFICSVHWLGFLDIYLGLLVLIFIPAWSPADEN